MNIKDETIRIETIDDLEALLNDPNTNWSKTEFCPKVEIIDEQTYNKLFGGFNGPAIVFERLSEYCNPFSYR